MTSANSKHEPTVQSRRLGISGRIAQAFLQSPLTPLIALVALLLGVFAVGITPKEEEPQINVTMANVLIPFPGATAKEVESLVTIPAEQIVSQIAGVEHVYSATQPGMAVLTVQYKVGEDRIAALVKLYDVLNSNSDWLPQYAGVGPFVVKPKGIDDVPVLTLTLFTKDQRRGAYDLQKVAHTLETELKRAPGTREMVTVGAHDAVVRVELDSERLAAQGLTVSQVAGALQAANASTPAGRLVRDNAEVELRTGVFIQNADDAKRIVVGVAGARPIYLSDVAKVSTGPELPTRYVTHYDRDGAWPAVTLSISKKPGANASTVTDDVLARVEALKGEVIPEGVEMTITRNYGQTASDKAQKLIQKLIFATLSVVALVWATLGRREAVVVGIAVVLTLAATLFASWAWGFTINRVSLFALIFSIGILVDDAIVVVENIHRRRALEPDTPAAEMIPGAVDEVGAPTILATLTVIGALLPMAFVTGLMGPYMSPIPINSSMGMLLSLLVAFVVTPWLALRLGMVSDHGPVHASADKLGERLQRFFTRVMRPFLDTPRAQRNRRLLWGGILLAIVISVSLAAVKLVVLKMLPFDNKSEFQVVVDMPTGTPVERTNAALGELADVLRTVPEVTTVQSYAGTSAPINFNGLVRQYYLRTAPEQGDLQVNLVDKHDRSRKSHEIANAVRPALQAVADHWGADLKVVEVPPGPPVMSPIVAEVYAADDAQRNALAKKIRTAYAATPDIHAIDDSTADPAPQIVLRIDQHKAALLGVSASDIARTVRIALAGEAVTPVHDAQAKYSVPVQLRLPAASQGDLNRVLKLRVMGSDGPVPVSELVQAAQVTRDQPIYHKDLLPVTYVFGDMGGTTDSPLYGMFGIRSTLDTMGLGSLAEYWIRQPTDQYTQPAFKWDGEWQVTYETFRDMGAAYAVGLILIYLLVVGQFRSYVTPLVIMAPIPLTIIGVMPGHALLGSQFTATSMIGMIALAGIIVRNSILLVDFIHLRLDEGVSFAQATIDAAATRAKPIVLTAVAAMMGALFILDDPIFNGLAISLLFGIFVSTLLTLVVIPVLYYAINRRKYSTSEGEPA